MAVIPYPHEVQDWLFGAGVCGETKCPQVQAQETRRLSTVLQSDGTPFIVGLPRHKMGFDLRVQK